MKRFFTLAAAIMLLSAQSYAGDKIITIDELPAKARAFIDSYFQNEKITFATVDDDIVRPDYEVRFENGTNLKFKNNGTFEKIESKKVQIPEGVIPSKLLKVIDVRFPDTRVVEYEVDKRTYEVALSNGLELTINKDLTIIEVDD